MDFVSISEYLYQVFSFNKIYWQKTGEYSVWVVSQKWAYEQMSMEMSMHRYVMDPFA